MNKAASRLVVISVVAVGALAGCGGGGGDGAISALPAEGVYGGALTGGPNPAFNMLILENGDLWAMYGVNAPTSFRVAGFVQGAGVSTNGTYTSVNGKDFGFAPAVAGSANATYDVAAKSIVGTVQSGALAINFSGGPIPGSLYNYDRAALLTSITGIWSTSSLGGETVDLNVTSAGTFTATSSTGCHFTGIVTPRPSGKNVFNVALTFGPAPCALAGQSASGIALAYPLANGSTQLIVAVVDGTRTFGTAAFGTR